MKVKEAWPDPRVREDEERVRALQPHARLADAGPAGLTVAELLSVPVAAGGPEAPVQ